MKATPTLVRAAVLLLALGGAAVAGGTPDAWITAKAKLALLTSEGVSGTAIDVDTVDGRVTLHGKVHTEQERSRAETLVRQVSGVKDVRDLLVIVSATNEDAVEQTDATLRERVSTALEKDQSLKGSSIEVQSVNHGVVLLSGRAATLSDHLHAVEIAAGIPGVRRVASEIQSPDKLADAEIYQDPGKAAAPANSTIGDAWITSATKLRLLADSRTPSMEINVDTRRGTVTLFGIVPTAEAKQAAEEDARKASGVIGVKNELEVVPVQNQPVVEARDDEVENAVVRLSGTVPTQGQRLAAAVTARSAEGVRAVTDDLEVAAN